MRLVFDKHKPGTGDRDVVLERLRQRLKTMHLRAPSRPRDESGGWLEPKMPGDITALTDEKLGRLHSEFAAMAQYAQFHLALRAVEHAVSKRMDKFTRARVRLEKSGTNDDKAAKVEVDRRTRGASLELLIGESEERLTQAVLDGFLIGRDLCSREMSRRMSVNGR